MKKIMLVVLTPLAIALVAPISFAKGKSGGYGSYSPGTGSKPSSSRVRSHIRKDGTYVESHRRSTPDKKFENNWSTKGNDNLYTGKEGTRVTPPDNK